MAASTTDTVQGPPQPGRTTPSKPPPRLTSRDRRGKLDVKLSPYLYISPFFIVFAVVGLFPLAYTAFVSVHDWHLIGGQGEFVGLQNFVDVVQQPTFATALRKDRKSVV